MQGHIRHWDHWHKDPKRLGRLGEWLAHDHLRREGYDVLARNWHAPFGEVDLIARRGGQLHFVEVKTRRAHPDYRPEDRVTADKERRYVALATYFLKQYHLEDMAVRYHVIGVEFDTEGGWQLEMTPMFPRLS